MYQVKQKELIIGSYRFFFDAWLYVFLSRCSCTITGPDGRWNINPAQAN